MDNSLYYNIAGGRIVNGQYLKQPTNQTATFGDFVDFECRVSGCNVVLEIFVNGMQAAPNTRLEGLNFDPRERNASVDCVRNEYVAKFWMVVNNRTLNTFKKVSCRSDGVISDTAYISDVIYAFDSVVNESTVYRESQSVTNCSCNQLQCHKNTADRAVFPTINIVSVVLCLLNIVW